MFQHFSLHLSLVGSKDVCKDSSFRRARTACSNLIVCILFFDQVFTQPFHALSCLLVLISCLKVQVFAEACSSSSIHAVYDGRRVLLLFRNALQFQQGMCLLHKSKPSSSESCLWGSRAAMGDHQGVDRSVSCNFAPSRPIVCTERRRAEAFSRHTLTARSSKERAFHSS